MFLFDLIIKFYQKKKFDINNIYILHYNHNFRKESKKEVILLKKMFKNNNFIYSTYV
jgi:hypothetical protein